MCKCAMLNAQCCMLLNDVHYSKILHTQDTQTQRKLGKICSLLGKHLSTSRCTKVHFSENTS
jgi:hypothetical protein